MLQVQSSGNFLDNLARFIKGSFAAHTVAIFQTIDVEEQHQTKEIIEIAGHASERNIDLNYKTISGHGIIGQIIAGGQDLIVENFLNSSQTLGFYKSNLDIKSITAIPVLINGRAGAIYCDSLCASYFNRDHLTTLKSANDLIAHTRENNTISSSGNCGIDFEKFYELGAKLINKLGIRSVEVLRVKLQNFQEIEQEIGLIKSINLFEKMNRLIGQALPSHFPMISLPNGENIILIDNMMVSFFINKIRLIAAQIGPENMTLDYDFQRLLITNYKSNKLEDIFDSLVDKNCKTQQPSTIKKLFGGF